jgi:hypothetical protein
MPFWMECAPQLNSTTADLVLLVDSTAFFIIHNTLIAPHIDELSLRELRKLFYSSTNRFQVIIQLSHIFLRKLLY